MNFLRVFLLYFIFLCFKLHLLFIHGANSASIEMFIHCLRFLYFCVEGTATQTDALGCYWQCVIDCGKSCTTISSVWDSIKCASCPSVEIHLPCVDSWGNNRKLPRTCGYEVAFFERDSESRRSPFLPWRYWTATAQSKPTCRLQSSEWRFICVQTFFFSFSWAFRHKADGRDRQTYTLNGCGLTVSVPFLLLLIAYV